MSKFGKWTLGILFAGLIGAYITGNAYTRLRFFPGTTINGVDVGTLNAAQAEEKLNESAPYFSVIELDADTRDVKTEVIDLGDIGYEADYDTQSLLNAQPHMGWVKLLDGAPALTLEKTDFTYDPALLSQRIDQLYCMQPENQVEPVNAYLVGGENSVSIEEADDGCLLIEEPARELITQAIDQEKSSVDLTKACYAKASRTSDDQIYQAIAKRTVSIYNKTVTVQIYDDVYESFHDGTLRQMVTINEDLSYTIDEDALKSYVHALAEKYPNVIHRRGLLSSRGDVVSVGVAGDTYEYTFDEAATGDNIRQILLLIGDQQTFACWTRDVTVSREVNGETITEVQKLPGLTRDEFGPGTDYGGTYIEISIDDQHMWYYENGELMLDTDVVTGTKYVTDSPCGVFQILNMSAGENILMEGSISDYWMAFVGSQYGIHDAWRWRWDYGGDYYLWWGSHGCINTPFEKVEELFYMVDVGTPVIIYEVSEGR